MFAETELVFPITDSVDNALAISATRRMCADIGFSESDQFLVATVVSELATNILHYAGQGEIRIRALECFSTQGVEVLAVDHGPGIDDIEKALTESYSTGGTLGLGLPSVKRIMDEFTIESRPGCGVRCMARKWKVA
jgi:Anti-sigma regulatory factor (Ser/Thr protein kinase)